MNTLLTAPDKATAEALALKAHSVRAALVPRYNATKWSDVIEKQTKDGSWAFPIEDMMLPGFTVAETGKRATTDTKGDPITVYDKVVERDATWEPPTVDPKGAK